MTSTEFTVGLESSRSSSKVLKPPGGGSSDIFGVGSAQPSVDNEPKEANTRNRLFGYEPVNANANVRCIPQRNASNIFTGETQTSVSRKKQYVRRNPITGEGFESPDNEKTAVNENEEKLEDNERENKTVHAESDVPARNVQTSIRVRNPPGGKSSGIF